MHKEQYLEILNHNLKSSARKLKLVCKWIFQQDNNPKHTAHIVKKVALKQQSKGIGMGITKCKSYSDRKTCGAP